MRMGTVASSSPMSFRVKTETTPGRDSALVVSMLWIRAWAWGLRRMAACIMWGSLMSST